jgi:hypothetical protein
VYDGSTWEVYAQIGANGGTGGVGDVTLDGVQTLTNKTIAFASNTLTGVVGETATQTLTNKTLTSPTITSTALITASAGLLEYDGKVPYFTPQGLQRGLVPGMQYYRLNAALAGANATGAQSWLGVGVTLSSSTVYAFEAYFPMSKAAGTTSHSVSALFGGTATLNNIGYSIFSAGASSTALTSPVAGNMYYIQVATASVFTGVGLAANPVALHARLSGTVSVNAGGTFIPQYQLSAAPGGAYTVALGAYFLIYPVGTSGSNTSVGTWA